MKNITKLIAGLGVVAGLGAAMLPLGSYAASEQNVELSVTVGQALSVALSGSTHAISNMAVNTADTNTMKDTVSVTCNSPQGYSLKLANTTADTALKTTDGKSIPALAAEGPLNPGTSAWGVQIDGTGNFKPVPANTSPMEIKTKNNAVTNDATQVVYGVSVAPEQAPGEYKASLKYTVVAK